MNSSNPEQLDELKYRTAEQIARVGAQLKDAERHLLGDIRHQFFKLLRKGVTAVTCSFIDWQERQVL